MQRSMPPISETEQQALDAGDVWFEAELFRGAPDWQKLLAVKQPELSDSEQAFLDNQVHTLCQMLDDWQIFHEHDLPANVWEYLKQERFFALDMPTEYGGHGFSAFAHAQIISTIATCSSAAAVTVMVPNSLGPAELILHYGTKHQKDYYLPRLASGEEIPCFALTGETVGSDAAGMHDRGIVCEQVIDGKREIGIRLTWSKRYITLAPVATLIGLAFKLYDPNQLIGKQKDVGITLALVPADFPGVETGQRHDPLGVPFLNGPTRGHDVFIPISAVIGGEEGIGQGWRMLMACLAEGRGISLPGLANACGQFTYKTTSAYARVREQFNLPIGKFEGVAEKMAEIAGYTYLIKACCEQMTVPIDAGLKPALLSAICKYHTTELMRVCIQNSMDIHGGKAIQLGPKNYSAMAYYSAPVAITVEGANILTRNLIIYGQGVNRCHPYLRDEIACLHESDSADALQHFDKLFVKHIGHTIANVARSFIYGLTGGRWVPGCQHGKTQLYFKQLTRMSAALAMTSEVALLTLGGDLKRRELMSARLGDVLSHLYLASSALRYYHAKTKPSETETLHLEWVQAHCLHQIQLALDAFYTNYPIRWLGRCLRFLIFPYGAAYRTNAKDKLTLELAGSMLQSSEFRDELTENVANIDSADHILSQLETAFTTVQKTEATMKKFKKLLRDKQLSGHYSVAEQLQIATEKNLLSADEIAEIKQTLTLIEQVTAVDDFLSLTHEARKEEWQTKVKVVKESSI